MIDTAARLAGSRAALAAALVLGLLTLGCERTPPATARKETGAVAVTVAPVTRMSIADRRERVGQVQAIEDVEIRARIEGFLDQRLFAEGSDVDKGDLLFVIEQAPYQAEVARSKAELASARAALRKTQLDLARIRELRRKGTISQSDLDEALALEQQAEANVQAREAELRQAQLNLDYTQIHAPISGRIGRSAFSVGDLVDSDSGALATLVMLDPIYVYWTVGEQVLLEARRRERLRKATAQIQFSDGSFYKHVGEVDFLDNRVDPSTGTQTVRAVFQNPDKVLLPGQYVTVVVQVGEEQSQLVIPQSAVQEDLAGRFVLVVDAQNVASIRRVTMGPRQEIFWVVEDGLVEGEQVIYQGTQKVRPGATVKPIVLAPRSPTAS